MRLCTLIAALSWIPVAQAQELVNDDGWGFESPWRDLGAQAPNIVYAVSDHRFVDRFMQCHGFASPRNLADIAASDPHFEAYARHYTSSPLHLGVRRGTGAMHVLMAPSGPHAAETRTLLSIRGDCEGPASLVAHAPSQVPLPAGLGWPDGLVPIRADGTAYLLAPSDPNTGLAGGLYAVSLDPPLAPTLVTTLDALFAAVSADGPGRVISGLITPDDALWLAVDVPPLGPALVEVARDGTVTPLYNAEQITTLGLDPTRLVALGELDAVGLFAGYELALIPLDASTRAAQRRLASVAIQRSGAPLHLVQASGDRLALAGNLVTFDFSRLDADRDLLAWRDEVLLGTHPHLQDTDQDGHGDGAERIGLDSDPLDASSPAPSRPAPRKLAPSHLISMWPFVRQDAVQRGAPVQLAGLGRTALCVPRAGAFAPGTTPTDFECRDPEGAELPGSPFATLPALDLDGRPVPFTPAIEPYANPVLVLTDEPGGDLVFYPSTNFRQLYRQEGDAVFAAIDLDRDCPLLGSEARRAADCGLLHQELVHRDQSLVILGYHAGLHGVVVRLEGRGGALFVVVDRERVRPLAHETAFGGSPIISVGAMSDGSTVATFDGDERGLATLGAGLDLDPDHRQAEPAAPAVGASFRHGLFSPSAYAYYAMSGPNGACFSAFGWTICGKEPPPQPVETRTAVLPAEWVPVPDGLERGEALFWAGGWRKRGHLTVSDPDWALWRVTRFGAVQRWIDAGAFAALLGPADRARLVERPLEAVRMTAASAEPWRVCFVEGAPNAESRLWELSFDATSRAPVAAHFVEAGAIACGYTSTGERVALRGGSTEATLAFETAEPMRFTISGVRDLVRLGASWLVLGRTSVCIEDATGQYYGVSQPMLHAAHMDGLVLWVEPSGQAKVLAEAEFCRGGRQNEEDLYVPTAAMPKNFWDVVARAPWESTASGVSLALRPDGLLLLAPIDLRGVDSLEPNPTWYADLLLGFLPSYVPTWGWDSRLPALDPYRREAPERYLLSLHAHEVRGLSVVPWTERWPDLGWGHLGGDPPPPRNDAPVKPEPVEPAEPNPEPGPPRDSDEDGGCAGGPASAGPALALALLLVRVRRRSWRVA